MYPFEKYLRKMLDKLKKEKRWRDYATSYEEDVLEHSIKMAWLIQLMIAIELDVGNPHQLDCYALLQCAVNHDIGESIIGDISYEHKTQEDVKNEEKAFDNIIAEIIPQGLHRYFPPPIDMSTTINSEHKYFWKAAEQLGYCMFALAEDNSKFDKIIELHTSIIETNQKEFKFTSVSQLCEQIKLDHQERLNNRQ